MSALAAATAVLTTGVTALAVARTAQAHAVDIAAAKEAILSAVMSTNPFVLAVTATAALVAALGTYIAVTGDSSDGTKEFTDSLKESKAAYDDLMASMGEEQASAGTLAAALRELMGAEEKTATQKELMKRKVDELNEAVPGLALAYDEAADALVNMDTGLKMGADDLDNLFGRAAGMDEYTGIYRAMGYAALAAYKAAVDQHSPSKEFAKAGGNDIQGIIQGAEAEFPKLAAVYGEAAKVAMESYRAASEEGRSAWEGAKAALDATDSFFSAKGEAGKLEYELWERTDGKWASEVDKYKKKLEMLTVQQEDQAAVVRAAQAVYEAVVGQYGAASEESYKYQKVLLEEKLAYQDLLDTIRDVTNAKHEAFIEQQRTRCQQTPFGMVDTLEPADNAPMTASMSAWERSGSPYDVARALNADVVMPDGTRFAAAYQAKAQAAREAMWRHLPSTLEDPRETDGVERHLSAITAAAVNAISGAAAGGSGSPIVVNFMLPDGTTVASHYFDPLIRYADANGIPILNKAR